MGFFVSRHLGLMGCNIAIMKRFLPLLILTGLLFGQDVLTLKNGESYKGTYIGKVGEDIVFKVPLTSSVSSIFLKRITNTKKFPIWSVETIVTKNGELTYPFDIPTKELSKQDVLLHKTGKNYKGTFLGKVDEKIIFKIEGEKSNSAFSINDVDIVITSRGGIKVELYYPFDIETIIEEDKSGFGKRASEAYLAGNQDEFLRQNTKPCLWGPWGLLKLFVIFIILIVTVGEENMP